MEIYIVTCNGKISQEGYATLTEALAFMRSRTGDAPGIYKAKDKNGNVYKIHPVRVKGL